MVVRNAGTAWASGDQCARHVRDKAVGDVRWQSRVPFVTGPSPRMRLRSYAWRRHFRSQSALKFAIFVLLQVLGTLSQRALLAT